MDSNDPNNPNPLGNSPLGMPQDPSSMTPAAPTASSWAPTPPTSLPDISQGAMLTTPATPDQPYGQPQAPAASNPWDAAPIAQVPATSGPTTAASEVPTAPMGTEAANPFLQPQNTNFSIPQAPIAQSASQIGPITQAPPASAANIPNPSMSAAPDPLNTAFTPTPAPSENPFGTPTTPTPDTAQPQAPGVSANPWDQQPAPSETSAPANTTSEFTSVPTDPAATNPNLTPTLNLGQPGNPPTVEAAKIIDQPLSPNAAPITSTPPQPQTPANPLPEINPNENAPTDLSHLIAGDESTTPAASGVYTPPVAADQNLPITPAQTPEAGDQTPPPGKHLNLTKVLLVAGIPIILIVAALSAYLILGVGKSTPQSTDQTSLPVEQTQKEQAPLTNPPQQIVAPSPVTLPEPSVAVIVPEPSPSGSPAGSLSPAMKAAQQKASPSPSPASSASPAASASTTLPLN